MLRHVVHQSILFDGSCNLSKIISETLISFVQELLRIFLENPFEPQAMQAVIEDTLFLDKTRKYQLHGCFLGVLTHTTAWEQAGKCQCRLLKN